MKTMNETYDAKDLSVLKGLEAVRKRPGMYIGDTSTKGLHHLIYEVIDNSIDEHMGGFCDNIKVTLGKDGSCTVEDNGRGIPTDIHPEEGVSGATLCLTTLHAGGKLGGGAYDKSGGLHGVGVSVVNALSTGLWLTVFRNGFTWNQEFERGTFTEDIRKGKPTNKRGTKVKFIPDPTIFTETIEFKKEILLKRFRELGYLNPGVTIVFKDDRDGTNETISYPNGLADYIADNTDDEPLMSIEAFSTSSEDVDVSVAYTYVKSDRDKVVSFVNSIRTPEGGTHETGFRAGLTRAITMFISDNIPHGDRSVKVTGEDCKEGLVAIISVRVREPQFEGQTKSKLGSTFVRPIVQKVMYEKTKRFLLENPHMAKAVMGQVILAAKGRAAAKRAKELVLRKDSSGIGTLPGKLSDCQSKVAEECELYLVEGESAGGSAKQGRDRVFQAILALKGKPLNTISSNITQLLKSEEINNIISALGCGVGDSFDISKLRYGKIIIMTDADVDGLHIQTLLLTLFFTHLKPLVDAGHIYLAQPPLFRYKKGKTVEYVTDKIALDKLLVKLYVDAYGIGKDRVEVLEDAIIYRTNLDILGGRYGCQDITTVLVGEKGVTVDTPFEDIDNYVRGVIGNTVMWSKIDATGVTFNIRTDKGFSKYRVDNTMLQDPVYLAASEIYYSAKDNMDDVLIQLEEIENESKAGAYIQRYKGLGEMNPGQLWETTMSPSNRELLMVVNEETEISVDTIDLFMGPNVSRRKEYIVKHSRD